MLKHRLIFGALMIIFLIGICLVDSWLDGSLTESVENKQIQATLLFLLIVVLMVAGLWEIGHLVDGRGVKVFRPLTLVGCILLAGSWYVRQFFSEPVEFHRMYVLFVTAFSFLGVFFYQAARFKTANVVVNCAGNFFIIMYLGFLSGFVLGVRIDFGVWALLMFVFTIKSSDIGAYTFGRLFGRHKFSPNISPGKTWEGLLGAVVFGAIVAVLFGVFSGIMCWLSALVFGGLFGVLGQLGDLAESMIKRDAEQKDSSRAVPGFGGILDVVDSVIATAPAAYLFFMFCTV